MVIFVCDFPRNVDRFSKDLLILSQWWCASAREVRQDMQKRYEAKYVDIEAHWYMVLGYAMIYVFSDSKLEYILIYFVLLVTLIFF